MFLIFTVDRNFTCELTSPSDDLLLKVYHLKVDCWYLVNLLDALLIFYFILFFSQAVVHYQIKWFIQI